MAEQPQLATISAGSSVNAARRRLLGALAAAGSVAVLCLALWVLHKELAGLSSEAVFERVLSIPASVLLASVFLTGCSYLLLTGYDAAAIRYVERALPYRQSALTSFMAFAIGQNVGAVALSGGTIRYRMYSLAGLTATEIGRIVIFISVTFALGASGLLGLAFSLMPPSQTAVLRLSPVVVSLVGVVLVALPCLYVAASFWKKASLSIHGWRFAMPRPQIAAAQIFIAVADLICSAAALYVLLATTLDIGFVPFLGVYLLAMAAGLISSVPGGIGVFEAVLISALPQVDSTSLLGAVLIYRLIYYIAPLSIALLLLVVHEARQHAPALREARNQTWDRLSSIAPQVIATAVFLAGVVLLISGASPSIEARLNLIARALPLPILELSHLAGSIVGVGLLILARGLYRRLHAAYQAALVALVLGIFLSLIKGLDYEEALILAGIAVALWLSRHEFRRLGSVAAQRFSAHWIAAIVFVLCVVVWVGMLSFRNVQYAGDLWWQFALHSDAPRMLRATVVAAVTVFAFALWKVLRAGPRGSVSQAVADDPESIRRVVADAKNASANLALLGDKRFLWSADQRAFIMYQVSGDSWIAMGDPVGPQTYYEDLVWSFRELVDVHNGRPVFYQVSDESLALYVDLGLTLAKLGEDARVSLVGFTLQGSERAELRQALNKGRKHGASFEVIPRADVPAILGNLRRISDDWLAQKSTAEKAFSLGAFSESYVANFDCAVVRIDNEIVAFANIWSAPAGGELSVDLMRHDQSAPNGIMDYLFVELMSWGAANDYRWFSLGMAPLAGMEQRALAPLWHKMGNLIFSHGESFYNFEGLRNYKQKFSPEWHPRYLACAGGWWALPGALIDASRLISGGMTHLLKK
jgi:phosphatidylglycerol lysyltransferase